MRTKILLIYTGGTIGMARDYDTDSLKPLDFNNLLSHIPELKLIDSKIEYTSFEQPVDSSNVGPEHWVRLAHIIKVNYNLYDGFVILHGTDTMAYSASALSFMLNGLQKPIIFTGSQLPVGDLRTDAKENLITSIHFASLCENGKPQIREVCIYFEYKLLRANRTTKINAENFDAFASPNYPNLGESGIRLDLRKDLLWKNNDVTEFSINTNLDTSLGLIKIFPGMTKSFIENQLNAPNTKVILIEAFGSGNIFMFEWLDELLRKKASEGLIFIIGTQCSGGMVEIGKYETSGIFRAINAISAYDLTTEAAVTKAIHLLGQGLNSQEFRKIYETDLRGEMTKI